MSPAAATTRALVVAIVLAAAPARAEPQLPSAIEQLAVLLHYQLEAVHAYDRGTEATPPRFSELVLAGARLHGLVGKHHVCYHVGFDLAVGATARGGGFAYDVALFPAGIAVKLGDSQLVGVAVGVGATGAIATLDQAAQLPIQAHAEFQLGRALRLLGRARVAWLAGARERDRGAPHATFADELDGMIAVRVGRRYHDFGFASGNGYFAGVAYRELLGARFAGIVIGYSIDAGNEPRHTGRASN